MVIYNQIGGEGIFHESLCKQKVGLLFPLVLRAFVLPIYIYASSRQVEGKSKFISFLHNTHSSHTHLSYRPPHPLKIHVD